MLRSSLQCILTSLALPTFVLTDRAATDLDEIWEYIAQSDLDAADRVMQQLYTAMIRLTQLPGIGRTRLELADNRHRFWSVNPYLIVYRIDTVPLQIIRVLHGARDIENLL